MRILYAECEIWYSGRGETHAPPSTRLILVKSDGTVIVHSPGGVKPLNYMPGNTYGKISTCEEVIDGKTNLLYENRKDVLRIALINVHSDITVDDDSVSEPGLQRDKTEDHLKQRIMADSGLLGLPPETVWTPEWQTGDGPVDLCGQVGEVYYLVELKRTAQAKDVDQILRYMRAAQESCAVENRLYKGVLAAHDIRPKALVKCNKYGITPVVVDR